jgi:hypothetical protein
MTAKADIREKVKHRLANIPSALTDAIIDEFVEDAHVELENALGASFATDSIPADYQTILTDMSEISVLDYMLDNLVKKSVTIGGDISINYSDIMNSLRGIREALTRKIEKQMNFLGTKRSFDYTELA